MKARAARIGVLTLVALGSAVVPAWTGHDKTPPQTFINSGPGARTTDTTPRFTFSSSEKNSRFVCKRDGKGFSPCDSPKTLKPLSRGRHGFYVRAIDAFANKDATAAAYVFKVVRP
jgi:large repetitive protein